jgi:hypothetical protein
MLSVVTAAPDARRPLLEGIIEGKLENLRA